MVKVKKLVYASVLIALGSMMYIFESIIPFPIPFGKWGFSNFVVLFSATVFDLKTTLLVAIGKSVFGNLIAGHVFDPVFVLSFCGSLSAAFIQFAAWRIKFFGLAGVSLLGSIGNNLTQALVGMAVLKSSAFLILLPWMLILGIPGAFANAMIVKKVKEYATEVDFGFNFSKEKKAFENFSQGIRNCRSTNSRDT
ncbi:Gx transporter family protein [Pseudothermotoga thermarum]|uniref:Heptaprenyl diphosphate synthase component I n=1 Tax=Pseudothermotoga thermarum DSM 5069 TaxID=688269 RepID=F7YY88_9THEM|nr:Gx transporter family protein [Pseudothermotoga thermarum]AEH50909.1 Heptaprenyl diphosphate synthase component I [Pseudothermotoga thermarum DSM 5069]